MLCRRSSSCLANDATARLTNGEPQNGEDQLGERAGVNEDEFGNEQDEVDGIRLTLCEVQRLGKSVDGKYYVGSLARRPRHLFRMKRNNTR